MILSQMLSAVNYKIISGNTDTEIKGITSNVDCVEKGCVFAAIRGRRTDGNIYVPSAILKGATAVLSEACVPYDGVTVIQTPDVRKALAVMCAAFYDNPQNSLFKIGITGTNGKTTTSSLLRHILTHCGKKCAMTGTIRNYTGDSDEVASHTTPEAPQLFRFMRRAADEGCSHFIAEVSSQALDQQRVYGINFDIGIITNISPEHLDWHGSMENYVSAKRKLLDNSHCRIINADDEYVKKTGVYSNTITYGTKDADIVFSDVTYENEKNTFSLSCFGKTYKTFTLMPGIFNVCNTAAAIACAVAAGVATDDAVKAAETFEGVKGRVEFVDVPQNIKVIIDYAHTPDGLKKILSAAADISGGKGRIILLFGCGGDRDKEKRPLMGKIAAETADITIITADNSRSEKTSDIIADIVSGIDMGGAVIIENREKAIEYALCTARDGDVVIIAGKGHEDYTETSDGRTPFDERQIIKDFFNRKR